MSFENIKEYIEYKKSTPYFKKRLAFLTRLNDNFEQDDLLELYKTLQFKNSTKAKDLRWSIDVYNFYKIPFFKIREFALTYEPKPVLSKKQIYYNSLKKQAKELKIDFQELKGKVTVQQNRKLQFLIEKQIRLNISKKK